jgi:hypothetical protein
MAIHLLKANIINRVTPTPSKNTMEQMGNDWLASKVGDIESTLYSSSLLADTMVSFPDLGDPTATNEEVPCPSDGSNDPVRSLFFT